MYYAAVMTLVGTDGAPDRLTRYPIHYTEEVVEE